MYASPSSHQYTCIHFQKQGLMRVQVHTLAIHQSEKSKKEEISKKKKQLHDGANNQKQTTTNKRNTGKPSI
jgi:hypothetical protein